MEEFKNSSQLDSEKELNQQLNPEVKHFPNNPTSSKLEEIFKDIREYPKYRNLIIKEYFKKLNQEEFDQLLEFDFQEQLKDNPPIEGLFSPEEELEKIKSLPREERKETLISFKEKLVKQRKAWAACRIFVERSIEFNPDVSKEKLMELIDKFSTQYGFDNHQKSISEKLIDEYYIYRKRALEIRQQFPNDYDLVKNLTGINIDKNTKLDVSVGPMTIDIVTDWFTAERINEGTDYPIIFPTYNAFAAQSKGLLPIFYTVINKDAKMWYNYGNAFWKDTRNHEYQHQENKIFRKIFSFQEPPNTLKNYVDQQDPEIKKISLETFFYKHRQAAFEYVKDEITACVYDRDLETLQYQFNDIFFNDTNYDYLRGVRNWGKFKDDSFYQETAQRMLVQEYRETIQKAFNSYVELVKIGKYSTQEATALLTDKPLEHWTKTVQRLLEQKK